MISETIYGIGGYCENCNESHNHPLNNVIEIKVIEGIEP
jgi:hypothetical protein